MYIKARQLQHSGNWAFGSVLHFNALNMKNTVQWLQYVPCSLTFKNSAFCNQSLHTNILWFKKKNFRDTSLTFSHFVTETFFYVKLDVAFYIIFIWMSGFKLLTRYIQFRQQLVLILLIVHFIVFGSLFVRVRQELFIYVESELCTT